MTIIEISALDNGAHRNQTASGVVPIPDGWAVIPDGMVWESFPFGEIEVDYSQNPPVVTACTPLPIPEPNPAPVPEDKPSVWDELDEAYQEGVNGAYDE